MLERVGWQIPSKHGIENTPGFLDLGAGSGHRLQQFSDSSKTCSPCWCVNHG